MNRGGGGPAQGDLGRHARGLRHGEADGASSLLGRLPLAKQLFAGRIDDTTGGFVCWIGHGSNSVFKGCENPRHGKQRLAPIPSTPSRTTVRKSFGPNYLHVHYAAADQPPYTLAALIPANFRSLMPRSNFPPRPAPGPPSSALQIRNFLLPDARRQNSHFRPVAKPALFAP